MDVHQLLARSRMHPEARIHFVGRTRSELASLSHPELASLVEALARELESFGLAPGQIVGICGDNSIEWLATELALLLIGGIPCPIPESFPESEHAALFAQYRLHGCVYVHRAAADAPDLHAASSVAGVALRRFRSSARAQLLHAETGTLTFSSGTSGVRKCLQLSRRGIANTMEVAARAWQLSAADHVLLFLPLANIQNRTLSYMALTAGCDVTICRPPAVFRAFKEQPISIVVAPPSLYEMVRRQCRDGVPPTRVLGDTMRLMFVGSATVSSSILEYFAAARLPLFEVYGMNEFGWIAFNLPGSNCIGSVGTLVEGVELVPQSASEIVVRGTAMQAVGYYVDGVEEHAAVFVGPDTVATGDLGELGPDRRLRLTGRRKNVLSLPTGLKIAPEALERRIEECDPRIVKALVFLPANGSILSCTLWVPSELKNHGDELCQRVRQASQAFAAHERLGKIALRAASELTVEAGMLTEHGKPNRARMLEAATTTGGP